MDAPELMPSTNEDHLDGMILNRVNPSANMWSITHPNLGRNVDNFRPWLAPDDDLERVIRNRKESYASDPNRVCVVGNKRAWGAGQQLLEIQADYLSKIYPEIYAIENDAEIINKATGDRYPLRPDKQNDLPPIAICGLLGQEDFCIIERQDDGRYIMVAGFVASPTNWQLPDFIGKDMDTVHESVDNYDKRLKKVVDRVLDRLPEFPEGIQARNNLFLRLETGHDLPHGDPYSDTSHITDPGKQIYLRSERETLTRLPATNEYPDNDRYVIFSIKPHLFPIEKVIAKRGRRFMEVIKKNEKIRRYAFLSMVEQYAENALPSITESKE